MKPYLAFLLLVLVPSTYSQKVEKSASAPFAGCYEVASLAWTPAGDTVRLVPDKFQLTTHFAATGSDYLAVRSLYPGSARFPEMSVWRTHDHHVQITWSAGLGGYRGTLKPLANGDLVGRLKEFCDYRCSWKERLGQIHVHKIACDPSLGAVE